MAPNLQAIQSLVNAAQGDPSGYHENDLTGFNPPPLPQSDQQTSPPPANNAQNAGPVKAGLRGVLARMLGNFSYGAGQAMLKASGEETDAERAVRLASTAHMNAQTQLANVQTQGAALQNQLVQRRIQAIQGLANGAGDDAFSQLGDLSPDEKALKASAYSEALMKGDMEPIFNAVKTISQQRAIFGRTTRGDVMVTADLANQYPMLKPFTGKPIDAGKFASLLRGEAAISPTVTNTMRTIQITDPDPNSPTFGQQILAQVPQSSTSQKILPGTSPGNTGNPATPSPTPQGGGVRILRNGGQPIRPGGSANQMMVGTDSQGRQVAGTPTELSQSGVKSFVKLDSGEAAKVNTARQLTSPGGLFNLVDQDLSKFKPGELEGLSPRWNEFLTGQVGMGDPRYVALRTHLNGLLSTALMQAHVGARGGEQIMEHFQDLANAGKMSMPTLRAAVEAERQYVNEKAMRPVPMSGGGFNWGGAPVKK